MEILCYTMDFILYAIAVYILGVALDSFLFYAIQYRAGRILEKRYYGHHSWYGVYLSMKYIIGTLHHCSEDKPDAQFFRNKPTYEEIKKSFLSGLSEDSVISYAACINLFNSIDKIKYDRDVTIHKLEEVQRHYSDNLFTIYKLKKELEKKNELILLLSSEIKDISETVNSVTEALKQNEETKSTEA